MTSQAVKDVKQAAADLGVGFCIWCRWHYEQLAAMPEVREGFIVLLAILGLMSFMALVAPA